MDFQKLYDEKLITVEEAAGKVKSGDWVEYGWSMLTPYDFDQALAKRVGELEDVKIRGGVMPFAPEAVLQSENNEVYLNSWHASGLERKLINAGKGFYASIRYSELPRYIRENTEVNVGVLPVTPMDKHGNFNFGLSASHFRAIIEKAEILILEINKNIPRALGGYDNFINIKDVDFVFEGSNYPMFTIPKAKFGDVEEKVAEYVVNELVDGATLQIGIGSLPSAIGSLIGKSDLKDLGVHTEMYVDSFVELSKLGKITGNKKNINPRRQTYAFAAGTQELYDFIDDNEELMAAPVDYVNDVSVCAAHDNFMSINSALEVDLYGQVSSETAGLRHISGAGGALDFCMGAYKSKGGKSFMTLLSSRVDKEGVRHSNIVPTLKPGTQATATRANTNYVVTEQGIVNLKGKSQWERSELLISIAHPDLREDLIKQAEANGIWRKSNK
ncbi:MAG: acetyl-CoA hydrolase/transferase C-terminal domain-containing protein [Anaerococcus sp.]|nr:acetyl-CoA hydrolase/transferase C-terminal domain-containing protein [Peptoniphilaceae bacterium]MDY3055754.1 acetyl-CoA hydrolase/transferase C-terminal domain-containing protein [Anaerococcus sp.]